MSNSNRLRRAWADYVNNFEWHFVVTLTSEQRNTRERSERTRHGNTGSVSRERLAREFRAFVHRLERKSKANVAWVSTIERGHGGRDHVHALLWCRNDLTNKIVEQAWRLGISHVRRYDARLGAAAYLVKEFGGDLPDDYNVSQAVPPTLGDVAMSACA